MVLEENWKHKLSESVAHKVFCKKEKEKLNVGRLYRLFDGI